jgi:hypothetical protein
MRLRDLWAEKMSRSAIRYAGRLRGCARLRNNSPLQFVGLRCPDGRARVHADCCPQSNSRVVHNTVETEVLYHRSGI